MYKNESSLVALSDEQLDLVVGGAASKSGPLVSVNVPIQVNVGVQLQNQVNVAVLSVAKQGGAQYQSLVGLNFITF